MSILKILKGMHRFLLVFFLIKLSKPAISVRSKQIHIFRKSHHSKFQDWNFCYVQWQRFWTLRMFALAGDPFLLLSHSLPPSFSRFWRKRGRGINPAMHCAFRWAECLITAHRPVLGGAKSHWSHPAAPGLDGAQHFVGKILGRTDTSWDPREGLSILRADPFSWGILAGCSLRAAWHTDPLL